MSNISFFCAGTLALALFLFAVGCADRSPEGPGSPAQPGNEKGQASDTGANVEETLIPELRGKWERDTAAIGSKDKEVLLKRIESLERLLRGLSPASLQAVMRYSIRVGGEGTTPSALDSCLRETLVALFLKDAERARVIEMLAASCPEVIGMTDIEFYIVLAPPLH